MSTAAITATTRGRARAISRFPPNRTSLVQPTVPRIFHLVLQRTVAEPTLPTGFWSWYPPGKVAGQTDTEGRWPFIQKEAYNQQCCGSCFIFASTEVLQARIAINIHTLFQSDSMAAQVGGPSGRLSQEVVADCANLGGCCGGQIQDVLQWLAKSANRIPTNAQIAYKTGSCGADCPNAQNMCACANDTASCPGGAPEPGCTTDKCPDFQSFVASGKGYYASGVHAVVGTPDASSDSEADAILALKREIFGNGPVASGYTVFQDFEDYWEKGAQGVYVWQSSVNGQSNQQLGGHAIMVMGWGSENGQDYWVCLNSWGAGPGKSWPNGNREGFFKLGMGQSKNLGGFSPETNAWGVAIHPSDVRAMVKANGITKPPGGPVKAIEQNPLLLVGAITLVVVLVTLGIVFLMRRRQSTK